VTRRVDNVSRRTDETPDTEAAACDMARCRRCMCACRIVRHAQPPHYAVNIEITYSSASHFTPIIADRYVAPRAIAISRLSSSILLFPCSIAFVAGAFIMEMSNDAEEFRFIAFYPSVLNFSSGKMLRHKSRLNTRA